MTQRRCAGCSKIQDSNNMIRITKDFLSKDAVLNKDNKIFGRSAYICYDENCINKALKKDKLNKLLKTKITQELKGQLLNELRNS